jgi:hypothetical protein
MSLWEFRQVIESAVPLWLVGVLVIAAALIYGWRNR